MGRSIENDLNMSAIPENFWKIVAPLIATARGFLEKGEHLTPIAFVGSLATSQCIPVLLQTSTDYAKDESALTIEATAEKIDADFIFLIMEAWSLRKDKIAQREAIMDKYGSIGASPYAIDIVSIVLETRHGVWVAQVPIKPKGASKKRRTFGTPEFRLYTEAEGRFVNLLPAKDAPQTLH